MNIQPQTIKLRRSKPAFRLRTCARALLTAGAIGAGTAHAADLDYLQGLLAATPEGGWVKANTSKFSGAWATGAGALPTDQSHSNPGSIVRAWSSVAWDSNRDQLILWGGGHGNYRGNEVYTWQGSNGKWTRGSLPSRVQGYAGASNATFLVVDDQAPQSAHTYDGNLYLPKNDMFMTLGGAAYTTGAGFQVRNSAGQLVKAGPWMWDPNKADANKVGGSNGSGYDLSGLGGNMWSNRADSITSPSPSIYIHNTSAYRSEAGKDVVYLTDYSSSGYQKLWRYEVGDVRNGGTDSFQQIGAAWDVPSSQATAAIDAANGLYIHTAAWAGRTQDLGVWDLSNDAPDPSNNRNVAIELVDETGLDFNMTTSFGMGYDEAGERMLLWDGSSDGTVWETKARYNDDGSLATKWLIKALPKQSATAPSGSFATGVLGKWQYVSELGAFIALNEFNAVTNDAEVWLYKSSTQSVTAVPEPGAWALMLAGLMTVVARTTRKRAA